MSDATDAQGERDLSRGVQAHRHRDVAEITRRLSEATAEILAGHGEDDGYYRGAG